MVYCRECTRYTPYYQIPIFNSLRITCHKMNILRVYASSCIYRRFVGFLILLIMYNLSITRVVTDLLYNFNDFDWARIISVLFVATEQRRCVTVCQCDTSKINHSLLYIMRMSAHRNVACPCVFIAHDLNQILIIYK